MAYQRFEIREWVYLKMSETSPKTTYRATSWNKVFDDTSLEAVSIDTKKLACLVFNKYHIQVEPVALKKFTVNQLIDYITSNVDYAVSDEKSDNCYLHESANSDFSYTKTNNSYDKGLQKNDDYKLEPSDVDDWIRKEVAKDNGKKIVGAFTPIVSKIGMTSSEWENEIFKVLKVRIPAQSIEKMNVGDLVFLYRMIGTSSHLSYITFGLKNQPKIDIPIENNLAEKTIDNIRNREEFVIGCFIIALISFLLPICFVGPNLIESGVVFSSIFEWFVGIVCWLGTLIGIELIVSKMRPFNRCRIAFSVKNKRLFSHYKRLLSVVILASSLSAFASQSLNLSNVVGGNINSSSYSIAQSNSEEEIIRDNLKVIIPIDDENRMTVILIVLAVAIAFNITVCTLFRKIVKKFTKMETDGVILERNGNPYDVLWHWDRESIWFDKNEKRRVMAIKIKVTKQLFFYHVLFTILILSTAYFAIIRPIIEIGK